MLGIARKCTNKNILINETKHIKFYSKSVNPKDYDFSKLLVLHKITRYEFEKHRNPNLSDKELKSMLEKRGSNFNRLVEHHNTHYRSLEKIVEILHNYKIETRVTQRFNYSFDDIEWANCILTAGGDGTFLNAASKVYDNKKSILGINTDIAGSEGHLLLPKNQSILLSDTFKKILNGNFDWLMRARIEVKFEGQNTHKTQPIELHDQVLNNLEYRFLEHFEEDRNAKLDSTKTNTNITKPNDIEIKNFALNEVFIGESLSARVSYYQMCVDDGPFFKQKSSGIILCTGTGSTSWCYNINKMSLNSIKKMVKLINKESDLKEKIPEDDGHITNITNKFNDSILFNAEDLRMAYTIRDPIINRIFQNETNRGFAKKVCVQSRCFDACLVIDGSMSYQFNDGAKAYLSVKPENSLRTIVVH